MPPKRSVHHRQAAPESQAGGKAPPDNKTSSNKPQAKKAKAGAYQARPQPKSQLQLRFVRPQRAWEVMEPRCAFERKDDLDEVQQMIAAGELDVARDELLWLISECNDFVEAHKMLGDLALMQHDWALARGHFGYAVDLVTQKFKDGKPPGPVPYRLVGNRAFFEAARGLAICLAQLGKPKLLASVVAMTIACDPQDELALKSLLSPGNCG